MAVIVNKEDDKNADLTRRINADLREKMSEASRVGNADPDLAEDSEYVKDFKKTGRFAWVWIVGIIIIVAVIVVISVNR